MKSAADRDGRARRNSSMADRQRHVVAHGFLDDLHQFGERKFKRDGGEFRVAFGRGGVGRREGAAGNGDAHPFAQRGIIAQFGGVGIARALDVREPVARFGMDVDFVGGMALDFAGVNAENQMAVGGGGVEFLLLLGGSDPSSHTASADRARFLPLLPLQPFLVLASTARRWSSLSG